MKSLLITFLFAPFIISAQELPNLKNANTITTVGYWNKGETKTYHVTNTLTSYKTNALQKETKTEFDINLKIKDSTENSYVFEMAYTNYSLPQNLEESGLELLKIAQNINIVYKTNELGGFEGILNKKELQGSMQKVWNDVVEKILTNTSVQQEKDTIKARLAGITNMLNSEDNIDAFFSNHILMIHGVYGIEISLNKPDKVEIEYPALNNIVLKGTGITTLREINKSKNECKFDIIEQPDKAEMEKYLASIFKALIGSENMEKVDLSQFKFSSETRENYNMELSSGWMKKISMTSTVNVAYKGAERKKITHSEYILK